MAASNAPAVVVGTRQEARAVQAAGYEAHGLDESRASLARLATERGLVIALEWHARERLLRDLCGSDPAACVTSADADAYRAALASGDAHALSRVLDEAAARVVRMSTDEGWREHADRLLVKMGLVGAFDVATSLAAGSNLRERVAELPAGPVGPLSYGRLTVVSGRPRSGKTAIALRVAAEAARAGVPAIFVHATDDAQDLMARLAAPVMADAMHGTPPPTSEMTDADARARWGRELDDALGEACLAFAPLDALRFASATPNDSDALAQKLGEARRVAGRRPLAVIDDLDVACEGWRRGDLLGVARRSGSCIVALGRPRPDGLPCLRGDVEYDLAVTLREPFASELCLRRGPSDAPSRIRVRVTHGVATARPVARKAPSPGEGGPGHDEL